MRSLVCAFVLFAACLPEETELDFPVSPTGGSPVGSVISSGVDASTSSDGGLLDGGLANDAFVDGGATVDAGIPPQDAGAADAPSFPEGDQIP